MYKWVIHRLTGKCELLRVVYSVAPQAAITYGVESSLRHSKSLTLRQLLILDIIHPEDAIKKMMDIKWIVHSEHPRFKPSMSICLYQIWGYKQLIEEVDALRKIPYSSENEEHEQDLLKVWDNLQPDTHLESRVSKQWATIGFQGDDPMTDFRGMGILGLKNLLYFVRKYNDQARKLLSHSNHPKYGYSMAIVGINITHLTLELLKAGHLKTHFYNAIHQRPSIDHFHEAYSRLFVGFDGFWLDEKPEDIMEFNRVREAYRSNVIVRLQQDNSAVLPAM